MKKYYRLSITAGDKHFVCDNIKGTDVIIAEFNNHLKKALRSFETKAGELKEVLVEWISRKGNPSSKIVKLPLKRRKKKW